MKFEKTYPAGTKHLDGEVTRTFEGKVALLDRTTGEVMHPVVGALEESRELYAKGSGLFEALERTEGDVVVFDVGLGAGSNALAALWAHRTTKSRARLHLVSFDRSLQAFEVARRSEEREEFGFSEDTLPLADALLDGRAARTPHVTWSYVEGELPETLVRAPESAHVVFWDPFSPDANPELWGVDAFTALRARTTSDAVLATYSSATRVRTALLLAGFFVGVGRETGAARPTTFASRSRGLVERPLDGRFLARVTRSSAPFPPDAAPDALERLRAHPQFDGAPDPPES